jgi:nuclear pore complex protein Nup205
MAEITTLDALQALHRELLTLSSGGGGSSSDNLSNELLFEIFEKELERLWERPKKNEKSRSAVKSGMMHHLRTTSKERQQLTTSRQGFN